MRWLLVPVLLALLALGWIASNQGRPKLLELPEGGPGVHRPAATANTSKTDTLEINSSTPRPVEALSRVSRVLPQNSLALWSASGEDLLQIYKRGAKSNEPMEQYLAYRALDLCIENVRQVPLPSDPKMDGAEIRQLDESRRLMRTHCAPFIGVSMDELLRVRSALPRTAMEHFQLPDLPDPSLRRPSAKDIARTRSALLEDFSSNGPSAIEWNSGVFGRWLQFNAETESGAGLAPILRQADTLDLALALLPCHLGAPCGRGTVLAAHMCTTSFMCADDFEHAVLKTEPDAKRRALIQEQARTIAQAIQQKKFDLLGLRP